MRRTVLPLTAATLLALSACSPAISGTPTPAPSTPDSQFGRRVFDREKVEDGVADLVRNSYDMAATGADCPEAENTEVKPGNTFTCSLTIDGDLYETTITVKDDDGTYEVDVPEPR